MSKSIRNNYFTVFVRKADKKTGTWTGNHFDNLSDAVKCAMSYKDRENTVYVKQLCYNKQSHYTRYVVVFRCDESMKPWFEDREERS